MDLGSGVARQGCETLGKGLASGSLPSEGWKLPVRGALGNLPALTSGAAVQMLFWEMQADSAHL